MWKNIEEPDRPQMTIWRFPIACWMPKATNKLKLCNTYRFSTVTVVSPARLSVTLYVHCLSCSHYSVFISYA